MCIQHIIIILLLFMYNYTLAVSALGGYTDSDIASPKLKMKVHDYL